MRTGLALTLALVTGPALAEAVTLGTDGDFPPHVMTGADGILFGFEPDLAEALCARAGHDCAWVVMPFDALEGALLSGEIDAIMSGYSGTEDRGTRFALTSPYADPGNAIFVIRKETTFFGPNGATVATQSGTWQAEYLADQGADVLALETFDAARDAVLAGEAEAMLVTPGWANDRLSPDGPFVEWGEGVSKGDGPVMAFRPEDAKLATEFSIAIRRLREDGTLDELRARWFN